MKSPATGQTDIPRTSHGKKYGERTELRVGEFFFSRYFTFLGTTCCHKGGHTKNRPLTKHSSPTGACGQSAYSGISWCDIARPPSWHLPGRRRIPPVKHRTSLLPKPACAVRSPATILTTVTKVGPYHICNGSDSDQQFCRQVPENFLYVEGPNKPNTIMV